MQDREKAIAIAGVILFGAIANVMAIIVDLSAPKRRLGFYIASFLLAGFSGVIGGIIAKFLMDNILFIGFTSGISAFAGISGLNWFKDVLFDILLKMLKKDG